MSNQTLQEYDILRQISQNHTSKVAAYTNGHVPKKKEYELDFSIKLKLEVFSLQ